MGDLNDLIDDIEAFQDAESLESKVGHLRRRTDDEIAKLDRPILTEDEKRSILENRIKARKILFS